MTDKAPTLFVAGSEMFSQELYKTLRGFARANEQNAQLKIYENESLTKEKKNMIVDSFIVSNLHSSTQIDEQNNILVRPETIHCLNHPVFTKLLKLTDRHVVILKKRLVEKKIHFRNLVESSGGLAIFGGGTIGRQALQECKDRSVNIKYVLDNDADAKESGSIYCHPSSANELETPVVLAIGNRVEDAETQLSKLGFKNIYTLSEFFYFLESKKEPELRFLDDLIVNKMKWFWLGLRLNDSKSLDVLDAIIEHRSVLNAKALMQQRSPSDEQWFDKEIGHTQDIDILIDCGGCDGDTAVKFTKANKCWSKIYVFEPSLALFESAREHLSDYRNVELIHAAISDRPRRARFIQSGKTGGSLSNTESLGEECDVISVDSFFSPDTSKSTRIFLKMDIEGEEMRALDGAKSFIKEVKPDIAIAAYHIESDMWKIPLVISRLVNTYQVRLRHYTDVAYESVLYFNQ